MALRLPYLTALGINAIQPLPVVEFPTMFSLGYNGVGYFSPETDCGVRNDDPALDGYLDAVNALLCNIDPGLPCYRRQDIEGTANQLRLLVDLCHLCGIAMILDVVYNHAGGDFTDRGLYFFDGQPRGNQNDGLREALRSAIGQAAQGSGALVDMERIARELASPVPDDKWRTVQCTESHDIVYRGRDSRLPRIADGSDSRSWYARSRSRVALGLTLTAPGIAHLFMGQEILEDKHWHDEPGGAFAIWWQGLESDPAMADFLRFAQDLLGVRRRLNGLRGSGLNLFHVHIDNRVLAFHRWVPGEGHDAVVVASLSEHTHAGYRIGLPRAGRWREVLNIDAYDHWPNPSMAGNSGSTEAQTPGTHGLPATAEIVIPANGLLVLAPDCRVTTWETDRE